LASSEPQIFRSYDPRARNPMVHFSAGVRFFFAGLGLLVRNPSLLALSFVPILLTLVTLTALVAGSVWAVGKMVGPGGDQIRMLAQAVVFLLAVFVSFLLYLPMARVLLAPFSEAISRRTHRIVAPDHSVEAASGWGRAVVEGAKLAALQIGIGAAAIITGLVFSPLAGPLGVSVTILFVALDFLDVPLSVRGGRLGAKLRTIWRYKSLALGFGAAGYLLLLVPLLNLLALPVGVIGATLAITSIERGEKER
jgi:CysZ protein